MQEEKEWEQLLKQGSKNKLREERKMLALKYRKERDIQLKLQVDFKDKEI